MAKQTMSRTEAQKLIDMMNSRLKQGNTNVADFEYQLIDGGWESKDIDDDGYEAGWRVSLDDEAEFAEEEIDEEDESDEDE